MEKAKIFGQNGDSFLQIFKRTFGVTSILVKSTDFLKFEKIRPVTFALAFGPQNNENNIHTDKYFYNLFFGLKGL